MVLDGVNAVETAFVCRAGVNFASLTGYKARM